MWLTRMVAGLAAISITGAPAFARTIVISELGHAPLVGAPLTSTADLKRHFREQVGLFDEAGRTLGFTNREYERVRVLIATTNPAYVRIPRHLDAMTGYWDGRVHALHDVQIPANQFGWEVDVPSGKSTLAVYIPNKCGNISFVRRPPVRVAARKVVPPLPQPYHMPMPAAAVPVAPEAAPVVAVAPAAAIPGAVLPAAVAHSVGLLPLLAGLPFIPLLVGGGGGNNNTPPGAPPLCPNGAVDP